MKNIIIKVLIMLMLPLILFGCNSSVTINFIINNETISYECPKNTIISNEILSEVTTLKIEGIYYNSEYTQIYNNEVLTEDTTLYLKEEKKFKLYFIINQEEKIYEYNGGIIINDEIIKLFTEEKVEGLYYDEFYTLKYKDEEILGNINIYIRLFSELTKDAIYYELDNYIYGISVNAIKLREIINASKKAIFEENDLSKCIEIRDKAFSECDKLIEPNKQISNEITKENLFMELDNQIINVKYNIDLFTAIITEAKQKITEEESLEKCVEIKNQALDKIAQFSIKKQLVVKMMRLVSMPQENIEQFECLDLTYEYVRNMQYYLGKYNNLYFFTVQSYISWSPSIIGDYQFKGMVYVYDFISNKIYKIEEGYSQNLFTLDVAKVIYENYEYVKSFPDVDSSDNDF